MKKEKKRIVLENIIVTDYAAEGKALAKIDGKVIFISGAVPGDLVDVFLTKNKICNLIIIIIMKLVNYENKYIKY